MGLREKRSVNFSNPFRFLLLLAVCAGLSACATPNKPPKNALPTTPQPRLVGTVALVNQESGFVLVDVGTSYVPGPGKTLKCLLGGKETAELKTTPEQKIPFISADIMKGTPAKGDQVFE